LISDSPARRPAIDREDVVVEIYEVAIAVGDMLVIARSNSKLCCSGSIAMISGILPASTIRR